MSRDRQLELRSRLLFLPVMVAAVLSLLGREMPSGSELGRMLVRGSLLWAKNSQCLLCGPNGAGLGLSLGAGLHRITPTSAGLNPSEKGD